MGRRAGGRLLQGTQRQCLRYDARTPLAGAAARGVVYLKRGFLDTLPAALRPACPPVGMTGRACEFTTTVYWPHQEYPRAGKRYAGHYAEVLE